MELLKNETILLIAPQPWEHIHLSKHHYAIELARQGNRVYFLEPPDITASRSIRVEPVAEIPGVFVVTYRPKFPFALRFHARWLFDLLMRGQVRAIREAIGQPIDVVWCFDFNLFSNLKAFQPRLAIFHPVDPLSEAYHVNPARTADAVFTVSEEILANFRDVATPSWVINHGLSRPFAGAAQRSMGHGTRSGGPIRVGYSGNLARSSINRRVLRQMVEENPSVEFHFWGPSEQPWFASEEHRSDIHDFIAFLQSQSNVRMHGAVSSIQLAEQLQLMDCLVLSYSADPRESDRSNSHKILEYLSTGKVIVSGRISAYTPHRDLMRMPDEDDDRSLPDILRDTLTRLDEFNSIELQDRRRHLALDNTYEKQLERIRARLRSLLPPPPPPPLHERAAGRKAGTPAGSGA